MPAAPSAQDLAALYRLAFEAAAEGLLIVDGGVVVAANGAAHHLLGQPGLQGRRLLDALPPPSRAAAAEALRMGGVCQLRVAGRPVALRVCTEGSRSVVLLQDPLTDGRQQRERDAEVERLEQVNLFKTQLLNTAAHELNTPLTPLRLQVHLLQSESLGRLTERQTRAVDVLDRSAKRLSMLVSDILDVARLESHRLSLDVEHVRLKDLVQEAAQAYDETARGVGVVLEVETQEDLVARADPLRVLQVLYNLVSNGIKFTPEGGRVRIRTGTVQDRAFVEVQDTGLGLEPAQMEGLFQPFSRVHDTESTAIPGTGLGLYISRGIVEQHGGRLEAASAGGGKGTTFRFTLPLAADSVRPWRPRPAPQSSLLAGPLAQRLRELI